MVRFTHTIYPYSLQRGQTGWIGGQRCGLFLSELFKLERYWPLLGKYNHLAQNALFSGLVLELLCIKSSMDLTQTPFA